MSGGSENTRTESKLTRSDLASLRHPRLQHYSCKTMPHIKTVLWSGSELRPSCLNCESSTIYTLSLCVSTSFVFELERRTELHECNIGYSHGAWSCFSTRAAASILPMTLSELMRSLTGDMSLTVSPSASPSESQRVRASQRSRICSVGLGRVAK